MLASNPVPTLNQQKADLGIPRNSLKPHPALVIESASGTDVDVPRGATSVNNADLSCGKMASV